MLDRSFKMGEMRKRQKFSRRVVLLILVVVWCAGCVKVPPQAVVLSRAIGTRIADIQASHEKFVSAYFALSRERIEDFLTQRWIPVFLGNFVQEAALMSLLESVQPLTEEQKRRLLEELRRVEIRENTHALVLRAVGRALGDPDRGRLVLQFSEAAIRKIEEKRKALVDPVRENELRTLEELRKIYAELREMQSTVTAHLSSIRKVQDEQDKVLQRLGLLRERDRIVNAATDLNDDIMEILDQGEDVGEILEKLKARLGPAE